MTREEKQKAIDALKISAPVMAVTQEEFSDYIQTLNKVMDWLEQKPVIDKIRAEIETKYGQCDICEYFEDYDYEENDISEYRPIGNIADILQIFDKYIGESEGEE